MADVTPSSSKCQHNATCHLAKSSVETSRNTASEPKQQTLTNQAATNSIPERNEVLPLIQLEKYKVRPGTKDDGRDYEFKTAALLSLRNIHEDVKDMWMVSNALEAGNFDDVVLHVDKTNGAFTVMIQTKYKQNSAIIRKAEFLKSRGDFALQKYFETIKTLNESLSSDQANHKMFKKLGTIDDVYFALFSNRDIHDDVDFLEKQENFALSFLNTNTNANVYKLNIEKVPENVPFSKDIPAASNIYVFPNQLTVSSFDQQIENEIRNLVGTSLTSEHVKEVATQYVAYITQWAKGKFGYYFYFTKEDAVYVLAELLLRKFTINLSETRFFNCHDDNVDLWSKITTQHTNITIVERNVTTQNLSICFIKKAVQLLLHPCHLIKNWEEPVNRNTPFCECYTQLTRKWVEKNKKAYPLDIYKCLWRTNKLPLLLIVKEPTQYANILSVLKFCKFVYKAVILYEQGTLPVRKQAEKGFETLADLPAEDINEMLAKKVKLQGRTGATLRDLVNKDMFQDVSCVDILNILFAEEFNIGNQLQTLPDILVDRIIIKTVTRSEILTRHQDEIFVLEGKFELDGTSNYNVKKMVEIDIDYLNDHSSGIIIVEKPINPQQLLKLQSRKPVHILSGYDSNHFCVKWSSEISTTIEVFRSQVDYLLNENTVKDFLKNTTIIEAVSGMGKTVLVNYVASVAPVDYWVIKVELNKYQSYFRRISRISICEIDKHLKYFYREICAEKRSLLHDKVFEKFLALKKVILLLDGFDEIAVSYMEDVKKLAAALHQEGYTVCITTRPLHKKDLEIAFKTTSDTIRSFTEIDQEDFLVRHFSKIHRNLNVSPKLSVTSNFVKQLLQATRHNLNDRDAKFTGIPLQTELLANVFSAEYEQSILNRNIIDFNRNFDLLYLYENYIEYKMDILLKRYGQSAYEGYKPIRRDQSLFALKIVFPEEHFKGLNSINRHCGSYLEEKFKRQQLGQLGIIYLDQSFNVNCVHRSIAEYLAAEWLIENVAAQDQEMKTFACSLIKTRFSKNYEFLFYIFDKMASKGCPLHTAILNDNFDDAISIIRGNAAIVNEIDAAGRSALHLTALRSSQFQLPYHSYHDKSVKNSDELNYTIQKVLNSRTVSATKDIIGYGALDYALARCSLETAHRIHRKLKTRSIVTDINLDYKSDYLYYCIIYYYKELFDLLLAYFIPRDLLLNNEKKPTTIEAYVSRPIFDSKQIKCFLHDYQHATLGEVFKCDLVHHYTSSFGSHYEDVRFAIAFGNNKNVKRTLKNVRDLNELDVEGNSLLTYAVVHKKINIVKTIIKAGANVNKENSDRTTPLHKAAELGYRKLSLLIIKKGGEIDVQNKDDDTALHLALKRDKTDVTTLILKRGANVNIQNNYGDTALHLAARCSKTDIASLVVKKGADFSIKNNDGDTALHLALIWHKIDTAVLILNKGADVNVQNNHGDTALHLVSKQGETDVTTLLLDEGANCGIKNNDGDTALHLASKWGRTNIATLIVQKGVDSNLQNNNGDTALHLALEWDETDIATLIAQKGANCCIQNYNYETPLHLALKSAKSGIDLVMAKEVTDFNIRNDDGDTPLHRALKYGKTDTAMLIVQKGADFNLQDNDGETALHLALERAHTDIATLIVQRGADFGLRRNNNGDTALHLALKLDETGIAKLIVEKGTDCNIKNHDGNTALHLALERAHTDIAALIVQKGTGFDVQRYNDGDTALHLALKLAETGIAKLIVEKGTDCNIRNHDGNTALHLALGSDETDLIKLIVQKGSDFTIKNRTGDTPLHSALKQGRTNIASLIVENETEFNIQNNDGNTALHLASKWGKTGIATQMLKKGVDFSIQNNDGDTALHLALKWAVVDIAAIIVEKEDNLNRQNNDGNTALHLASEWGITDVAALVVEKGTDLNIRNNDGNTALHLALKHGKTDTAKLIVENGADVNTENNDGVTALQLAWGCGKTDIVTLILEKEPNTPLDFDMSDAK